MGLMIDGVWNSDAAFADADGSFKRKESSFRDWVEDGPGARFRPEAGRYHLYVSLACPWAHRTLIFRKLKGLEAALPVSVVHWFMGEEGWTFEAAPGATGDRNGGRDFLRQVYLDAKPDYTGRVTVPVLWDNEEKTIVSNESSEIIRMLNGPFSALSASPEQARLDFYPEALREEIDAVNARVYDTVNNGVYKSGFATRQAAYDKAVGALFESLDWLESRLSLQRYLVGSQLTEADWRLFTTLVRFDPVYHGHFKCNRAKLIEFPNLWAYTRELYQLPGIAETVNFEHITRHYYSSHASVNPTRIVPIGPDLSAFEQPHGRQKLAA